jgi:hypothetical protein
MESLNLLNRSSIQLAGNAAMREVGAGVRQHLWGLNKAIGKQQVMYYKTSVVY